MLFRNIKNLSSKSIIQEITNKTKCKTESEKKLYFPNNVEKVDTYSSFMFADSCKKVIKDSTRVYTLPVIEKPKFPLLKGRYSHDWNTFLSTISEENKCRDFPLLTNFKRKAVDDIEKTPLLIKYILQSQFQNEDLFQRKEESWTSKFANSSVERQCNFNNNQSIFQNKRSQRYQSKVTMISPDICPHCDCKPGQYGNKIFNEKLDWSHAGSRCGSMLNIDHQPGGGTDKIYDEKPDWSHVGSRCGSMLNIDHKPGGGTDKIYDEKPDWSHVGSRCGSMANIHHQPGGGVFAVTCKCGYLKYSEYLPGVGESKIFYLKDELPIAKSQYGSSYFQEGSYDEDDDKKRKSTKKSKVKSVMCSLTNGKSSKTMSSKNKDSVAAKNSVSQPIKKSKITLLKRAPPPKKNFGVEFWNNQLQSKQSTDFKNNFQWYSVSSSVFKMEKLDSDGKLSKLSTRLSNAKEEAKKRKKGKLDFYRRFRITMSEESKEEETKVKETKAKETKVKETKAEETKVKETIAEETKAKETKVKETKDENTPSSSSEYETTSEQLLTTTKAEKAPETKKVKTSKTLPVNSNTSSQIENEYSGRKITLNEGKIRVPKNRWNKYILPCLRMKKSHKS